MAGRPAIPAPSQEERAILAELGVSRESLERLALFIGLLFQWQARMNLVASSTLKTVWSRHVIDSLQALPLIQDGPEGAIADLGSGGGFPGVPLAIVSGRRVNLFEANAKKAAFLHEALRLTGGQGHVVLGRIEDIAKPQHGEYAFVTARALAPLPQLLAYAAPFLEAGAAGLFLKGKDLARELTESAKSWRIKADSRPSLTDSEAVLLFVKEASRV
jgi:16S rRNA (guanine527-N7)-methyltransferase